MNKLNLILCLLLGICMASCSSEEDECSIDKWVGTFVFESDCENDGAQSVIEVDENGNPINDPEPIESITFSAGAEEGTIDFDGFPVPVDGCNVSLGDFGDYSLAGDILTVVFSDDDCKIFVRE